MHCQSLLLKGCALTLVLLQAGVAGAQGFLCLPGVNPRRIDGDLNIVTHCELEGTEVRGDVTLFAGGSLTARDVHVRGALAGSSADFVEMDGGRVDKDFRLEQMVGDLIRIEGVELHGNVELLGNRSRLEVLSNAISHDLQVDANVGGVLITGNTLENLRCADNAPAPLGADNRVSGKAEGQCANLQLEVPPQVPPEPTPPPTPPPPTTPPPTTPPPTTPPPTTPPPTTPPPTSPPTSPPPTTPPAASFVPDPNGGGGGAMGLFWLALLPFAVWRRAIRR